MCKVSLDLAVFCFLLAALRLFLNVRQFASLPVCLLHYRFCPRSIHYRFFLSGGCKAGVQCRFKHPSLNSSVQSLSSLQVRSQWSRSMNSPSQFPRKDQLRVFTTAMVIVQKGSSALFPMPVLLGGVPNIRFNLLLKRLNGVLLILRAQVLCCPQLLLLPFSMRFGRVLASMLLPSLHRFPRAPSNLHLGPMRLRQLGNSVHRPAARRFHCSLPRQVITPAFCHLK